MIGRRYEQERLDHWVCSGRSELIVVHGRRRVGKTYFITSCCLLIKSRDCQIVSCKIARFSAGNQEMPTLPEAEKPRSDRTGATVNQ